MYPKISKESIRTSLQKASLRFCYINCVDDPLYSSSKARHVDLFLNNVHSNVWNLVKNQAETCIHEQIKLKKLAREQL